jgi:hypothetical protein
MASPFVLTPDITLANSDGIYAIANPGGTPPFSNVSLYDVSRYSYFEGPNGNSTISYNAWGRYGNAAGANRIYGFGGASSNNYSMNSYGNLYYFYEQTNYQCRLDVTNNLPAPPPPPPPMDTNVQDVNLTLRDSSNTYSYLTAGTGTVNFGGGNVNIDASQSTSPLIQIAYWTITIGSNPMFPGASADLSINGTSVFTGQAVNAGPTPTTFDFNTWGTYPISALGGYTGFNFVLAIY